ncbi:MAG: bifunctional acetaldehyde-CoA/alcohol dehydrogenase, partial [Schleiferilactobacillus perolens]
MTVALKKVYDADQNVATEVNDLVAQAQHAFKEYQQFDQAQVNAICQAVVNAAIAHSRALAFLAWKETGRGNAEDKAIKNIYASQYIWNNIKDDKT